jgi:hypothetical protein
MGVFFLVTCIAWTRKIEEIILLLKEMTSTVVKRVQVIEFDDFGYHYRVLHRHRTQERTAKTFKEILQEQNDKAPGNYVDAKAQKYSLYVTLVISIIFNIICVSGSFKTESLGLMFNILLGAIMFAVICTQLACGLILGPKTEMRYSMFKQAITDHNANATDDLVGVVMI